MVVAIAFGIVDVIFGTSVDFLLSITEVFPCVSIIYGNFIVERFRSPWLLKSKLFIGFHLITKCSHLICLYVVNIRMNGRMCAGGRGGGGGGDG